MIVWELRQGGGQTGSEFQMSFLSRFRFKGERKRIQDAIRRAHEVYDIHPAQSVSEFKKADSLVASIVDRGGVNVRNWQFLLDCLLSAFDLDRADEVAQHAGDNNYPEADEAVKAIERFKETTSSYREELKTARQNFLSNKIAAKNFDVIVSLPTTMLDRRSFDAPVDSCDLQSIFAEIFSILRRNHIPYAVVGSPSIHGSPRLGEISKYISFRTQDPSRQGLHFCITEKRKHYSFDRKGNMGWSEFSDSTENDILTLAPDQATADAFFQREAGQIISSNSSKYIQPDSNLDVDIERPYIFVALQTMTGPASRLASVPIIEMLEEICETAKLHDLSVIAKPHPKWRAPEIEEAVERLSANGDLSVSRGSIHKLIASSVAVCTVNSSVGAEALLHLKPVYVFGRASYQPACFKVRERGAFRTMFEPGKLPHDEDFIRKFFYVFRNSFQFDITDESFTGRLEERILQFMNDDA